MNDATIKAMQEELVGTESEMARLDALIDRLDEDLQEARQQHSLASGNRTALRRLLKQNDALPEAT